MSWPDGGPWVVAATSAAAGWEVATAALAAASKARVAVLLVVGRAHVAHDLLRDTVATYVEVHTGGADPLRVDDVVAITHTLARAHGLVLVGADDGLLVPLGHDGWTLADLAKALPAPVVVVTAAGPDSTNHAALALDALTSRDMSASVVAVGDGDDLGDLPVALAGRIPTGAADRPEQFVAEAASWLDPLLHGTRGLPAATVEQATVEQATVEQADGEPLAGAALDDAPRDPARSTVIGRRVGVVLVSLLVLSVLVLCALDGLHLVPLSAGPGGHASVSVGHGYDTVVGVNPGVSHVAVPSRRPATSVCPQYAGTVVATIPDAANATRVDTAWGRIERWLAAHAPTTGASLRSPAPPERIAATQVRMSVAFPPDLVASLRRHDGAEARDGFSLPPFYRPLPLDEIVRNWEVTCGVLAAGPVHDSWWNRSFVPFATAGDGGCLLVDQRLGGHGRVGEFYPDNGTGFERWPASFVELLEGTAQALETGTAYAGRYLPVVNPDGRLDWKV